MSYGQNQPSGLQALKYLNGAPWNNQTNSYLIASGYANNIFRGDLVYINSAGYIKNLADCGIGNFSTPTLGVFAGCSYVAPTSVNPIDPASPGKPFWPSGTVTVGQVPATAFIIDDPNTIFEIQSVYASGVIQSNVGTVGFYGWAAPYALVGGIVQGNTTQGTSYASLLTAGTYAQPTYNLFIKALSANPNNVTGVQYNNAEVLINNHYYRQLPSIPSIA